MLTKIKKTYLFLGLGILLICSSCGPVNRFTKAKKIPREYSLNYCIENTKAPKSDLNKNPWIVYSDREKNETYNKAGGKVKAKDLDYLEPFLVIGKKKNFEYLKLIKYTPEILKNGKLDYKKAEYYGWIPKSKLLLNQQSVTDIASGKKNKSLAILTDTLAINEPKKFFSQDSIRLYQDIELKTQVGTISPYSIVYQMKESEDGSAILISRTPYLNSEKVKEQVLGWIDKSLIKDIGTGLHAKLNTVPLKSENFVNDSDENIINNISEENNLLSNQYQTIKYNPILSYSVRDSLVAFRTGVALPIFDYSNNYIFNVNGNSVSYKQFRSLAKGLKNINISFVFEGGDQTISQFPQIVNALQNLQASFEQTNDDYTYNFNTVMTFDETGKLLWPLSFGFTSDYSELINFLSDKAEVKNKLQIMKMPRNSWSALRKAVDVCGSHKDAINLIVLIGDRTRGGDIDVTLTKKLLENNCRVVGFQVYAGEGDNYNNFVLNIEDMINSYSGGMIKKKGDILVSPEQMRRSNHFKKIDPYQNGYRLDFPDNSITQGGLFFPQKSDILPMEILTNNIDTIISQIKDDNTNIVQQMSKAFRSVGNNRTQFDSLFMQKHNLSITRIPQKSLITSFINETPGWYMSSKIVVLEDSINKKVNYRLMLSEIEMKDMKDFIATLSQKEVEVIDQHKKAAMRKSKRKPCNCPEDDLFTLLDEEQAAIQNEVLQKNDSLQTTENGTEKKGPFYNKKKEEKKEEKKVYANTMGVRKHLMKSLLNPIKYCKLCKEKNRNLKSLTLAEAQYRITGSPVSTELLQSIKIKDLKNRKKVTDEQLEQLVLYYKKKKAELENVEQFDSNSETYYWLDRSMLP